MLKAVEGLVVGGGGGVMRRQKAGATAKRRATLFPRRCRAQHRSAGPSIPPCRQRFSALPTASPSLE